MKRKLQRRQSVLVMGILVLLVSMACNQPTSSTSSTPYVYTVSTFAGTGSVGSLNGTGTNASFSSPYDIVSDGTNLFVADKGNHLIRKIVISTGEAMTLAGSGTAGSVDGTGTNASFKEPKGLAISAGNLFVADTGNHLIRQIVISTGEVTTLAGKAGASGSDNGTGTDASFKSPYYIATDGTNLYVSDTGNHLIRKIVIGSKAVTTLAGSSYGFFDGSGTSAQFYFPCGITTDSTNLYVADSSNARIRKIVISTGNVSTLAGSDASGTADGTGSAVKFTSPWGISRGGDNLYITDYSTHQIRKIVISTGEVTTIAGTAGSSGAADGTGSSASFYSPCGIVSVGECLYVSDTGNHLIRKLK